MIHEIAVELQAELRRVGCPFQVVDRETLQGASWGRQRIVVEPDPAGDKFGPPRSQHGNPRHHYTRFVGVRITIFGQSTKGGALEFEHRRVVDDVLDLVLGALRKVAAGRRNRLAITGGREIQPAALEKSEVLGGVGYELAVTFERAVSERTYAGEIRPEATLGPGGIRSTTRVARAHADDDDDPTTVPANAETACGA